MDIHVRMPLRISLRISLHIHTYTYLSIFSNRYPKKISLTRRNHRISQDMQDIIGYPCTYPYISYYSSPQMIAFQPVTQLAQRCSAYLYKGSKMHLSQWTFWESVAQARRHHQCTLLLLAALLLRLMPVGLTQGRAGRARMHLEPCAI